MGTFSDAGRNHRRHHRAVTSTIGAVAVVAVAIGAPGGRTSASSETTEPAATGTTVEFEPLDCDDVFELEAVQALADGRTSAIREHEVSGILMCQALVGGDIARISIGQIPSSEWATKVRPSLQRSLDSGDVAEPAARRQIEDALELIGQGSEVDPDEACALFELMAHHVRGADEGVNIITNSYPRGGRTGSRGLVAPLRRRRARCSPRRDRHGRVAAGRSRFGPGFAPM